uniref:cardiolipin synthase n=1 Tax=Gemmiger formicilis TaxID=745368 RepID=UPI004028CA53
MKKRNWRLMLRRVLNLVFSRIVVTGVLLLLQAFWLFALFYWLADYAKWFGGVGVAMSIIMCLALIRQDSTVPEFKISWMILFAVMPVQGGILYLLWGNKRPALGLRHRLERAEDAMAPARKDDPDAAAALQRQDPRAALTARYLHDYGPMPVCGGTAAKYYPDGQSMFADMLPALQGAQHSIYVESFIIGMGEMWGQIHEILRRKAAAGLDVRVIYDDAGCLSLLPHNYAEMMRADGIRAFSFNRCVPVLNLVMNNRDHRKIMDVDGHTVFTGGVNLSDEYINAVELHGHWKDTGVRVTGEAAWNFTAMFLEFWHAYRPESVNEPLDAFRPHAYHPAPFAGEGWVQPFSDSPLDGEAVSAGVYIDILAQARDYVYIFTPYLIIDDVMQAALCAAAKRGVDVRIVTPGVPDKKVVYRLTRSYYAPLLRAGVRIYEYTPGFIHAKSYLSDDTTGVVGTINMDYRSLYLHFECGTYLYRTPALQALKADVMDTLAKSREISPADCRRHFWSRMLDAVLRIAAPLC